MSRYLRASRPAFCSGTVGLGAIVGSGDVWTRAPAARGVLDVSPLTVEYVYGVADPEACKVESADAVTGGS